MGRLADLRRSILPSVFPEPIDEADYRRLSKLRIAATIVLALINASMRAQIASSDPRLVPIFDEFLIAATVPQVLSLVANVGAFVVRPSITGWRAVTFASVSCEIAWAIAAAWAEGISARPLPILVLLILVYRTVLDRRIGAYALTLATLAHGALLIAERMAWIPLNPFGFAIGPTQPGVPYPPGRLLWIPIAYTLSWWLATYGVRRLRLAQRDLSRANHALNDALASVSELARLDPLTSVWNRRYLEEYLEAEMERGRRLDHVVTLLMVDLDHFKLVNDEHGHVAGDAALVRFAEIARRCVRKIDVVARYGGEEFVVVLPETRTEQAMVVAERIRAAQRDEGLHTTVSIGVADSSGRESVADVLAAADDALYEAKHLGRDRVVARS